MLEGRYPGHYIIYNVSGRQYMATKFNARVVEGNWASKKAPTLGALYNLACSIYDYLAKDTRNVVVVHCIVSLAVLCCLIMVIKRYSLFGLVYIYTVSFMRGAVFVMM